VEQQAVEDNERIVPSDSPAVCHGLIVDYLGIFDDVAQTLLLDDTTIRRVITNIAEFRDQLPGAITEALAFFPGVDWVLPG
jgi:type I restriction enzyme R subunit